MPRVSVILTAYNRPQWMQQAIESVLNQTYQDIELIIMEDNSPDILVGKVLDHYEGYKNVTIYRSSVKEEDRYKTARYATLINEAVRNISSGEYLTYLADDDFYYDYRIEIMLESLTIWRKTENNVHVVWGTQNLIDIRGKFKGQRKADRVLQDAWNEVDHNSVLHTRESYEKVKGWRDDPETWKAADAYFWRKLTGAGYLFYPVNHTDRPTDAKRYHADSIHWLKNNNQFPSK